jgi:hypothetical protein
MPPEDRAARATGFMDIVFGGIQGDHVGVAFRR